MEPREQSQEPNAPDMFRWVRSTGVLRVFATPAPRAVIVTMHMHTGRPADQQTTLELKSQTSMYQVAVPSGWRVTQLLVPVDAKHDPYRATDIRIKGEPLPDSRNLGMAVHSMSVSDTTLPPDPVATLWRWGYVVALWIWLLPLVLVRRWPWWMVIPVPLILILWMGVNPVGFAFAIPQSWEVLVTLYLLGILTLMPRIPRAPRPMWRWSWLVLLMASACLYAWHVIWPASVCLILAWKTRESAVSDTPSDAPWDGRWWWLAACVGLALIVRFLGLDDFPIGMFRDEARHGLLSQQIADGQWIVYSTFADLPAGYFYVSALPVAWLGHTAFAIRAVAALAGSASVVLVYWVIAPWWGKSWALWTSLVLAVMLWHVGLSRIAWPATMGPLLTLIAVGALYRAIHTTQVRWGVLAGIATGAMTLFYHSSRLMPLVVGLSALIVLWQRNWPWRQVWRALLSWVLATVVMALPMLFYAFADFGVYMRRIGATSITQYAREQGISALYAVLTNLRLYLGMLFVAGDANPRHFNLGAPQLSILEGVLAFIGMMQLRTPQRRPLAVFVLGWFVIGMLPGILSVDAPHALRTVEAIVPLAMLIGLGGVWMMQWVANRWQWLLLVGYAAAMLLWGVPTYLAWQRDPQTLYAYDARMTAVMKFINTHTPADVQWYVPKRWLGEDVVMYLRDAHPLASIEGPTLSTPPANQGIIVVHPTSRLPDDAIKLPLPPAFASYADSVQFACVGDCRDVAWLYHP